ncbi:integrase, catalytic region, zinc finger, CCHC-type containing protein [Tanacetum coccineum]
MGMMMVRVGDGGDEVVGDDVDGGCDDGVVLARQVAAACGSGDEGDEGGVEMVKNYLLQELSGSDEIFYEYQEPQTVVPSESSIILRDFEPTIEEDPPVIHEEPATVVQQEDVLDFSIGFGFFAIHKDVAPTAPVLRRSSKVSQQPERYGNLIDKKGHDLGDHNEPTTYQEAIDDFESKKWLEAIRAWMQCMKDNEVWNLLDLPPGSKSMGYKWVFKKKTDIDCNVNEFKARLGAKGYTQTQSGSKNRPPMLNKENYVPWSSRLLRYAKSRPNEKLIYNSIINGPYVRRMIPEPGDTARAVPVPKMFHEQTDNELTKVEIKQMEADDQAIQTILLGLPEDIYAAVDSCETAQEIWLRVQQMMKGSDIGIQEKKAKLFNE